MGIRRYTLALAVALLALPAAAQAADYVPGELIVRFKPSTDTSDRRQARAAVDGDLERSLPIARTQLIDVDGRVMPAVRELNQRADVAYAHPNYIWQMSATPNDPSYGQLYGMDKIGAPAAWDTTTGSDNVIVAVIDSGVDMDHPDLNANIWLNPGEGAGKEADGVDNDGNGKVDDWRGWDFTDGDNDPHDGYAAHGTHVAGTIGARGNNGVGVTGVNWNVKLMALRVGKDDRSIDLAAAVQAVDYAGKNGAHVVNMSFGGPLNPGQPIPQAQLDAIRANPQMFFAIAAGNETNDNDAQDQARYPCNFASGEPNAVCVAATDQNDALAEYSNFGPNNVQLAAPGSSILSTQPLGQIHDDFDTVVPGRWTLWQEDILAGTIFVNDNPWGRTTAEKHSGTHSYADSPSGFYNSDFSKGVKSGIEFSAPVSTQYDPADPELPGCFIDFWWKPVTNETFATFGVQMSETSGFLAGMWQTVNGYYLSAFTNPGGWQHVNWTIGPWVFKDKVRLRLGMEVPRGGVPGDGMYIDDFKFWCGAAILPEYKSLDGTSMATPHVAGVAALVKAQFPAMTPAEIKQRLLGSVEVLPGLAGKVSTSGRLNAARALAYAGPPNTLLQGGPQGQIVDSTPTFEFGVGGVGARASQFGPGDANVRFECQIDSSGFVPCTSPFTTPELPAGAHSFNVRAVDPGGNADATPESRSFTIAAMAGLKLTPSKFKVSKKGTKVTYEVARAGFVKFSVERKFKGRKVGGKCKKQTKKNKSKRKCTGWKSLKAPFERNSSEGKNSFKFNGRWNGKPLAPGAYRMVASFDGASQTAKFKIKKPKK